MWFSDTFFDAADSLLALAVAETEDYSNNATGVLTSAFQVVLGGTEVPLPDRLDWLEARLDGFGGQAARIAAAAATAGLQQQEYRTGGWRGARLQPNEWHPRDEQEERNARSRSLELLFRVSDVAPQWHAEVATKLAEVVRVVARIDLLPTYLEQLHARQWSVAQRANLVTALRDVLAFEEPSAAERKTVTAAIEFLRGQTLGDRIAVILATPFWDLYEERLPINAPPPLLRELALEIASEPESGAWDVLAEVATNDADPITLRQLYRELGELDSEGRFATIVVEPALPTEARVGYLVGRQQHDQTGEWTESILAEWGRTAALAQDLPFAIHMLPPSDDRVHFAVRPVELGQAPLADLNRFLYGSWVNDLSLSAVSELLRPYRLALEKGELALNDLYGAMQILDFWAEANGGGVPTELRVLGERLVALAGVVPDRKSHSMLDHVRGNLSRRLGLEPQRELELVFDVLRGKHLPNPDDLNRLAALAEREPETVCRATVEFLLSDREGWSIFLEEAALISLVGVRAGVAPMLHVLTTLPSEDRAHLVRHMMSTGADPDPFFAAMIAADPNDEALVAATRSRFWFPGEVVVGSYATYLSQRRDTLERWAGDDALPEALRGWARDLIPDLEIAIRTERVREAEGRE